jgi:hypothetical protein
VRSPAILVLIDDTLYKELDEATNQICAFSTKHFFPSSAEEDHQEELDDDIDNCSKK